MRLLGAALSSLAVVTLAAAEPAKKDAKEGAKPAAASTEPKKVKTLSVAPDGRTKATPAAASKKGAEPAAKKNAEPMPAKKGADPKKAAEPAKKDADSAPAKGIAE